MIDALTKHSCIAFASTTPIADRWSFPQAGRRERTLSIRARLTVNTAQAAIDAALAGLGIVRVLSYQIAHLVAHKKLQIVLASAERQAVPVQIVQLPGLQTRGALAFVELAARRLRERLASAA